MIILRILYYIANALFANISNINVHFHIQPPQLQQQLQQLTKVKFFIECNDRSFFKLISIISKFVRRPSIVYILVSQNDDYTVL